MGSFVKGEVVVIPFPFSDLSNIKRRPALVVTNLNGDDIILCQITSSRSDNYSIGINDNDFITGGLRKPSNIRPNRIFTADSNIVIRQEGKLKPDIIHSVIESIISIISH